MDAGAAVLEPFNPCRAIHVHRIGCLLHVLHLSVNTGMENAIFTGPLGQGSWHEWPKKHKLVGFARLALVQHEPIGLFQPDTEAL